MIDPELRQWCYEEAKKIKRNEAYGYTSLGVILEDAEKLYGWITRNREYLEMKAPTS